MRGLKHWIHAMLPAALVAACSPAPATDSGRSDAIVTEATTDVAPDATTDSRPDAARDVSMDAPVDVAGDIVDARAEGMACDAGLSPCAAGCTDTASSASNCGACGHACPARVSCAGGVCQCPTGMAACGSFCIDVASNPTSCGACGHACGPTEICASSACVACPSGTASCANVCIDTATDLQNCGACFARCGVGYACAAGACSCPSGRTVCGATCSDTARDDYNCGACGHACTADTICTAGTCVPCTASGSPAFATEVQPIFTTRCATAGCHAGSAPAHGFSLEAGRAYTEIVGVPGATCGTAPYVAPGDVSRSVILFAIAGGGACAVVPMPLDRTRLAPADVDTVRRWVCSGALP